jgi:REP element-mobilizing transposase RayT
MVEKLNENLTMYRRKLPHWRQSEAVYFVTWRLHLSQPELKPGECQLITTILNHFDGNRYELLAYVVMHDHIHVIVEPKNEHHLNAILHSWKSFSANRLKREYGRKGNIWQDEYFDRIIRDEEEFLEKAQYILNNPRKKWPEMTEYAWVGVRMAGTEARPTGTEARPTGTEARPDSRKARPGEPEGFA